MLPFTTHCTADDPLLASPTRPEPGPAFPSVEAVTGGPQELDRPGSRNYM